MGIYKNGYKRTLGSSLEKTVFVMKNLVRCITSQLIKIF